MITTYNVILNQNLAHAMLFGCFDAQIILCIPRGGHNSIQFKNDLFQKVTKTSVMNIEICP